MGCPVQSSNSTITSLEIERKIPFVPPYLITLYKLFVENDMNKKYSDVCVRTHTSSHRILKQGLPVF